MLELPQDSLPSPRVLSDMGMYEAFTGHAGLRMRALAADMQRYQAAMLTCKTALASCAETLTDAIRFVAAHEEEVHVRFNGIW